MPLTYGEAKEILARYVGNGGVCATNPKVDAFVRETLDYLLISGSSGNLHKFCFCAVKGCLTIPYELQTPLKVKIDGRVGTVWDKWYEYHPSKNTDGCIDVGQALTEDPNYYPTIYDLPANGARVAIMGTCHEDPGAHVVIKGEDLTGRQIITEHNGQQVIGEYLSIKKDHLVYTQATFGKITEVYKTKTIGYTPLYWLQPAQETKGFLADYSPIETKPTYRRFRFTNPAACSATSIVTVFGRIRLKPEYADNDLIPVENRFALNLAGQTIQAMYNKDPNLGAATDNFLTGVVSKENEYKRTQNGQPVEVYVPTSGGSVINIIGSLGGLGGMLGWRR